MLENNALTTVASGAGYMTGGGNMAAFGALLMVTTRAARRRCRWSLWFAVIAGARRVRRDSDQAPADQQRGARVPDRHRDRRDAALDPGAPTRRKPAAERRRAALASAALFGAVLAWRAATLRQRGCPDRRISACRSRSPVTRCKEWTLAFKTEVDPARCRRADELSHRLVDAVGGSLTYGDARAVAARARSHQGRQLQGDRRVDACGRAPRSSSARA